MAALKLLSTWQRLCASARGSGGAWAKVKCERREGRDGARVSSAVRTLAPARELASGAPDPGHPRSPCLASPSMIAFAGFASAFPTGPLEAKERPGTALAFGARSHLPGAISASPAASWERLWLPERGEEGARVYRGEGVRPALGLSGRGRFQGPWVQGRLATGPREFTAKGADAGRRVGGAPRPRSVPFMAVRPRGGGKGTTEWSARPGTLSGKRRSPSKLGRASRLVFGRGRHLFRGPLGNWS